LAQFALPLADLLDDHPSDLAEALDLRARLPAVAGQEVKLALPDKLCVVGRLLDPAVDVGQGKFFAPDLPLPEMAHLIESRCAFLARLQFGPGGEELRGEPRRLLVRAQCLAMLFRERDAQSLQPVGVAGEPVLDGLLLRLD